jgi:hypothetical protein
LVIGRILAISDIAVCTAPGRTIGLAMTVVFLPDARSATDASPMPPFYICPWVQFVIDLSTVCHLCYRQWPQDKNYACGSFSI